MALKLPSVLLTEARSLIAAEVNWTQGAFARDVSEADVSPIDPTAVKWDSCGAVNYAAIGTGGPTTPEWTAAQEAQGRAFFFLRQAARTTAPATPALTSSAWNDRPERTHAQVLACFDAAIVLALAAGE